MIRAANGDDNLSILLPMVTSTSELDAFIGLLDDACAQLLAEEMDFKHPEDAFIAGLLHDIGKMILDDFMNDDIPAAVLGEQG